MTTLHFSGNKADAVRHIVEHTSLAFSPYLRDWSSQRFGSIEADFAVTWTDNGLWSSGEEVLLDLLGSIEGRTSGFAVCDMHKLDAETRLVALEAIGLCYGITIAIERQDA